MDIVTLSLGEGDPAIFGPLDQGTAVCGDPICDVGAQAVENASSMGTLVVAAAGNGGNIGYRSVNHNSLNSPGVAPSAIAVAASANSHVLYQTVRVNGSSLGNLRGLLGDGPKISSPVTAPVKDVTTLGNDGLACAALPAGSLTGAWALVQRGTCFFSDKINFAQAAGAIGVVVYQSDGIDDVTTRMYVQNTGIPAIQIGNTDGNALKVYLGINPNAAVTVDPTFSAADNPQVNTVAPYSSRGPSIGNFAATRDFGLKPELAAPGTNIYTATQKFDPNSDTYNATGYTTVNGTSYAVPFVAGVAAMAKAKNPNLNTPGPLEIRSRATRRPPTCWATSTSPTSGAGKLNAADAVSVDATLEPAAISFGPITALAHQSQPHPHQCERRRSPRLRFPCANSTPDTIVAGDRASSRPAPLCRRDRACSSPFRFYRQPVRRLARTKASSMSRASAVPRCIFPTLTWWASACPTTFSPCRTAPSPASPTISDGASHSA